VGGQWRGRTGRYGLFLRTAVIRQGTLAFATASFSASMAHLSPDGELLIPFTTLHACVYSQAPPAAAQYPQNRCRGRRNGRVARATRTITDYGPTILLEIHGTRLHADCERFLLDHGYRVKEGDGELTATPQLTGRRPSANA
jgi:hypothetical protein